MSVDGVPNVRACTTPVRDGMEVKHQNAYPSLDHDWLSILGLFSRLMPVGFYYKTFTHPWVWRLVEPIIRRIAGLGEAPSPKLLGMTKGVEDLPPTRHEYAHLNLHTEIAIVGSGPAGLAAALEAAKSGAPITLIDEGPRMGGHLLYQSDSVPDSVSSLIAEIESLPNVRVLKNASCFGLYEGNLLGIVQNNQQSSFGNNEGPVGERLIHLRTKRLVVATGVYEVPLVFENNDLVGIMLSSAVERLVNVHGIKPAEKAVIVGGENDSKQIAKDLDRVGVWVEAIVPPDSVSAARGRRHVSAIIAGNRQIACDLIVVCGNRVPDAGLIAQAGGKLEWDEKYGAFVPIDLPPTAFVAGEVTGCLDLDSILMQGRIAGNDAVRSLGLTTTEEKVDVQKPNTDSHQSSPFQPPSSIQGKSFVCFCEDVTAKDLHHAIAEGFDHIETLKRYTTVTMGPCQGKMCQLASISICGHETGKSIADTGTTTSRPPTSPVSLGALAGERHHPVRLTPMHYKHEELDCVWMDMGEWKRPLYYRNQDVNDERACVEEEYRAVRERVGIIDLSTLGKLDVKGVDAAKLLDKVYTNRLSDLRVGRARYSLICDDSGIILDDGTISRLSDDHFFITTTTGNIDFVQQWLEWWSVETDWCVHITNVTSALAAINVAGPSARDTLSGPNGRSLTDCDLKTKAFPYMACRQTEVGGVPCLMLRIGFVGETGWEIHYPAEYGDYLWDALMEAGEDFGIRPFGVEAQRLLRLEKRHFIAGVDTDATSNPLESDMAWVAKLDKEDFIGKAAILRLQERGMRERLIGFAMEDRVVPEDGAAIVAGGRPVGRVTSVRFSPANGVAVGLAWVPDNMADDGEEIQVQVRGRPAKARIKSNAFYDSDGKRLRM